MTTLSGLRDAIEDAENERRTYARGMFWIVSGGLLSVAVFAFGVIVGVFGKLYGIDTGGPAATADILGAVMVGASWATGVGWWNYYNQVTWIQDRAGHVEDGFHHRTSRIDNPTRRIVLARRAFRDAQDEVVHDFFMPSVTQESEST